MIRLDCRHYRVARPCLFNKTHGAECPSCRHFSQFNERILFIKLDAIGDVLRSASLLPAIIAKHDSPYIVWLTGSDSVKLVNMIELVDEVVELSEVGLARIATGGWDHVYSLSNDLPSAALASMASRGGPVVGYSLQKGLIHPSNAAAERWLEMAAFDRVKRENQTTYQRLMLDIIGHDGPFEPPRLKIDEDVREAASARVFDLFQDHKRERVAINIGAGTRWPKKMLNVERIRRYASAVADRFDVDILLVGGASELDKAKAILASQPDERRVQAALTPASVAEFVATLMEVDVLLTGDTLALHVAAAIGLPTVAVFGPTSMAEIADFGGLIQKVAVSGLSCLGCYGDCKKTENCMTLLEVSQLVEATGLQLAKARSRR